MSDPLGFLSAEVLAAVEQLVGRLVDERLAAAVAGRREPRWMTVEEAADYARCKPQHIYDLRSDGRLGKHGERGAALVDRNELDAHLEADRRPSVRKLGRI